MADNVGSIEYIARIETAKLRADAVEADRIAKGAGDSIGDNIDRGSSKAANALKTFAKVAAVALAAATVGAVAFGVSAVKAFTESENAMAQTNAVLKSTAGVAGVTAKTVTDLANSLQKQTRYSDESIRSAENMLLTFTNIGKKTFPDATKAVLDMSTAMGTDLQSTAIQVGKALQDPVRGATALQRVGVRLSESQKTLIQNLVNAGDAAGAQAIILKELQTEFGGSAVAAGQTFAGQLDILKNQLGEVQEGMGLLILKGITPLVSGFVSLFEKAGGAEGVVASIKATMDSIIPTLQQWWSNIRNVATQIGDYLGPKIEALWHTITENVIPAVINFAQAFGPAAGAGLVGLIGLATDGLNIFMTVIAPVIQFLADNTYIVWAIVAAFAAWKAVLVIDAVVSAFQAGMVVLRAETLLTTGLINGATGAAGGLRMALLGVLGPWQIILGIAGVAVVIKGIQEISKALDDLFTKWAKAPPVKVGKGNLEVAGDSDIGLTQRLMNAFSGFRASGGPVQGGRAYVVGEKKPELFVPRTSGTIIPEVPSWGGGTNSNISVTVNMQGIMARSKNDLRDIGKDIIKVVNDELRAKNVPVIGNGALA